MLRRRLRHGSGRRTLFAILIIIIIGVIVFSFSRFTMVFFGSKPYISPLSISAYTSGRNNNIQKVSEEKIGSLLAERGIKYNSIIIREDSSFQLILKNGEEVLFSRGKQIELQISSLQRILSRLTIEGKSFTRIDLRFDRPVILFR